MSALEQEILSFLPCHHCYWPVRYLFSETNIMMRIEIISLLWLFCVETLASPILYPTNLVKQQAFKTDADSNKYNNCVLRVWRLDSG